MAGGVAHGAAEHRDSAIEQGCRLLFCLLQLSQEVADGFHLLCLNEAELGQLLRVLAVVGEAVVFDRYAGDRLHAVGAGDVERDEAGGVGLEGEMDQVEHEPEPAHVVVGVGYVRRLFIVNLWLGGFGPFLIAYQTLLHLTDGGEVLVEPVAVGRADAILQSPGRAEHSVHDALPFGQAAHLGGNVGGRAVDEQFGKEIRRPAIGGDLHAGSAVGDAAVARAEGQGWEARIGPQALDQQLVERDGVAECP